MTNVALTGIKACVFDAYGTLFDFAAAARGCRDELGTDTDKLTAPSWTVARTPRGPLSSGVRP